MIHVRVSLKLSLSSSSIVSIRAASSVAQSQTCCQRMVHKKSTVNKATRNHQQAIISKLRAVKTI